MKEGRPQAKQRVASQCRRSEDTGATAPRTADNIA